MLRGIEQRNEIDPSLLLRDTRTTGQRIGAFFKDATNVSFLIGGLGLTGFFFPELADILFVVGVGSFCWTYTRPQTLPFRMPLSSQTKDYHDLKPGSTKPNMASGITFLGNDAKTGEEIWFTNSDMRTHMLIFGSTGSGKTEALVSFAFNSLIQSSGFIYVDGKGDNSLYAKIFSMVRSVGREDDLLLINFMTGARDIIGPQEKRLSNTLNPFASGSSSMLSQLVVNLMDSSSGSSDGDMWKGRAIGFVESLMKLLVYMRDLGALLLDANSVRYYFDFPRLEAIVMDHVFIRDKQEPVSLDTIPEVVLEPLKNYVNTLPGYNKEKKGKQVSQVLEQHGFITMQLTRVFTSLSDTYGHIIRTNLAEVDFKDVVLNRRILVVLLPALEKSPAELANLGKVVIASLKAMMASGLGEDVEGDYHEVVERKPTNAPSPYVCILDEYGYYAVEGFAVVPAQARSLGFSAIFAGQDLPAFQKASKEEAASIGANTNIKICMKLEDPVETLDFFVKTAGEAYVTKVDSFQTKENSTANTYQDTKSSSFEKRARIDLLDLKEQSPGEFHIFFGSKIVRARAFYASPKPVKRLRVNQFLKVEPPPDELLHNLSRRLVRFQELLDKGDLFLSVDLPVDEISSLVQALNDNEFLPSIERSVNALLALHNKSNAPETPDMGLPDYTEETSSKELNIFTPMRVLTGVTDRLRVDDYASFSQPLLNKQSLRPDMLMIERVSGRTDRHAASIAEEIVKDMQSATVYPPEVRDTITPAELTLLVSELTRAIYDARDHL